MKEIQEKYLVLICNENGEVGNGIIVGKYLLTAGHCVGKEYTCAYTKAGQRLELTNCVAVRYEEKRDDGQFGDYAVFELADIESPLVFACDSVKEGETYTSLSIEHIVTCSNPTNVLQCHDERHPQEMQAKVLARQGYFFACEMEKPLKRGNSGSPLIKDGKVYGILHGGRELEESPEDNGKICIYMAIDAIKEILNN